MLERIKIEDGQTFRKLVYVGVMEQNWGDA